MKLCVTVLVFMWAMSVWCLFDPNHVEYNEEDLASRKLLTQPRDEDGLCGTGIMDYFWEEDRNIGHSRGSSLNFYDNGTFIDTTFSYYGSWYYFGRNNYTILVFDYTSTSYVSPYNTGSGSMINHHSLCGYWYFEQPFKWYCNDQCISAN